MRRCAASTWPMRSSATSSSNCQSADRSATVTSTSPRSTGRAASRLARSHVSTRPAIGLRTTRLSRSCVSKLELALEIGELLFEFAFAGRQAVELDGVCVADVAAGLGGPHGVELPPDGFHFAVDALEVELERGIAELARAAGRRRRRHRARRALRPPVRSAGQRLRAARSARACRALRS